MIMGHETGHLVAARRGGMAVTDFFVGFGPVLYERRIGATRVGVRAIPVGGYVKVPGMTAEESVAPELESATYRAASYPRKVIFASAGSFMHVAMALVLAWGSLVLVGAPSTTNIEVMGLTQFANGASPAEMAGVQVGDHIVALNGAHVTLREFVNAVHGDVGRSIALTVSRNGHTRVVKATPIDGRFVRVDGTPLASGSRPSGYLGVEIAEGVSRVSVISAIPRSVSLVASTLVAAVHAIVHVFSPAQFTSLFRQVANPSVAAEPSNQASRPESIVGVVRIAVQGADTNWANLFSIFMMVNLFVGVLNMLPLLPLDGGYVAVATYERVRSRREKYHASVGKLAPLAWAVSLVLVVLFVCTVYLDIVHPVSNPFR
jgi:membrane-associated protease RseP (regulator of RpoE activity)